LYPSHFLISPTFTITVADPCDAPKSVTQSALVAQQYTITDNAVTYTVPIFTVDPAWCEIIYSYAIDDTVANAAISFDAVARKFTFNYAADLSLCGATNKVYQIAVTGRSGPIVAKSATATFALTLKNPCIDPAFV